MDFSSTLSHTKFAILWLLLALVSLCQRIETVVFQGCDHVFRLNPGLSYLESPYYPRPYPKNTSCRYKFKAPKNYAISLQCNLNIDKGAKNCSTEFFYIAPDGDLRLRGSEQLCGSGSVTRRSLFNTITLAYISGGSTGSFKCSLNVRPQPCDCGWSVNTKIVNGEEANANEYAALVALYDTTSNMPLYCSGAIISPRFIVTAAHCAHYQPNPDVIKVLVGRQNIKSDTDTPYADAYSVSEIKVHPHYTPNPTRNDIALMKTIEDIEFKKGVAPICLPPLSNMNNDFAYSEVSVAGWGLTTFSGTISSTLQKITLLIVEQAQCRDAFAGLDPIFPSHICAYDVSGKGKDSCQFDSGGPVMLKHVRRLFLVGVISFGKACGTGEYPIGVNERITYHLRWILNNTEDGTCHVQM